MDKKPTYSELEKNIEELEKSLTLYKGLIETTNTGFVILDQEGKVIDANQEYIRLSGHENLSQICGRSVVEWTADYEKEKNAEAVGKCFREGQIRNLTIDYVDARGKVTLIEINATVVKVDGVAQILTLCRDVTERKQAEEALKIFKESLENATDAIGMSTPQGRHYYQNRAFSQLFGDIGENPPDTVYVDKKVGAEIFRTIMSGGQCISEIKMYAKDGRILDVLQRAYANKDENGNVTGLVGIHTDITERRKTDEALQDSRGRFRAIFDNANDGILLADGETKKFHIGNNAICQMLGYSPEEIKNLGVADIHPKEDLPYVIEQFEKQVKREIVVAKDIPVKRKDGSVFYADVNTSLLTLEGNTYLTGIFRDTTERRKAEEQNLKIQKLEAIGNLAAGIAHNFNNVLAGILGNISCIKEQYSDDKELYEIIEDIEKASLRGKNLASQLVTFAGGGGPVKKIMSIDKLIKDSANLALGSSNVKYEFNIADNLGLVNIDEGQISQVIANLVANANQAMPDGGVISIQAENISLKNKGYLDLQERRYIKIAVKDQGVGIPKDKLSKIFDPFFSTKEGRTGIGLSTAYSIIKRHNGQIYVESEPGKGAIFNIYLPAS